MDIDPNLCQQIIILKMAHGI